MKAPRTRIANVVADRSLKAGSTKRLSRELAAYLLDERRVHELDSILRDVQADWAEQGRVEVLAASAHDLSSKIQTDIKRQVKALYPNAKTIIVTPVHDPSVIGGVRLRLADRQLDLSVEAKLNRFKQLTTAGKD
ncbi:MAG TPA: F0F1 ATP synthase subunit delta [Candidatus Saccharimonadales bacterium]|nr:F0F1 ATP synthase subunit delta [Candidatus Saccharimonadales bacterium]